jgi:DNA-binding SARP family transcriptional activator/tetratricopeptide (TPR) repeat protein
VLRLRTLGGLSIERLDGPAPPLGVTAGRRRLALLAMLAANGTRGVPRDKLIATFWPESETTRARHALDQTLYALKRDLACDTLFVGRDELALNPADISSDIAAFNESLEKKEYAAAVAHYTGPFLDGVFVGDAPDFERWAENERVAIERDVDDALESLATEAAERNEHRTAADWWERLAARNPRRTSVIISLMSALSSAGERESALRHANTYHTLVSEDGDLEANPAVSALADRLKKAPAAEMAAPVVVKQPEVAAPPSATLPRTPPRSRRRLAVFGVGAAIVATTAWAIVARPGTDVRGWVLPADFENRTGDSTFDRAIDVVLRVGLEQSGAINVFPRSRVPRTLARMGRSSSAPERLTESLALEVAQRENVRAIVVGSIDRVDSTYVIVTRLVDATSGVALASERSVAASRADVIGAIDDVVRKLRRDIGESAAALARHDRPLARATTRSLDALRKYTDGLAAARAGRYADARELWSGAAALDSDFAMAHAELGAASYFAGQRVEGDAHFSRALALLDRLTDRERFQIRAAAESWRGNRETAISIRRSLLAEYPDDQIAWGQIGYDYMRLGRHREATDALRKQIALDSGDASAHINLATSLKASGDFTAALQSYDRAFALQPTFLTVNNLNHEYGATLILAGRITDARAVFDTMARSGSDQRAQGARSRGLLALFEGKHGDAIAHLRRAVTLSQVRGRELTEARNRLFLAAAEREKGWPDSARTETRAAYDLFRRAYFEPAFLVYLGRALARDGQTADARIVFDSLQRRVRPDNPNDLTSLRILAGELAVAHGRADSAVRVLRLAMAADSSLDVVETMARATAAAGDTAEAIRLLERIARLAHHTFGSEESMVSFAALGDVGSLYERSGNSAKARVAYEQFLADWPAADTDLVLTRRAREFLNRTRAKNWESVKR